MYPPVNVQLLVYDDFFVRGEVVAPGQFPFIEGTTVQNAVTRAGGFTIRANTNRFTIVRRVDNKVIQGNAQLNTVIKSGDVITVLALE